MRATTSAMELPLRALGERTFATAYLNRTFALFLIVGALTMFGLCVVYSSSAAIVAQRENARARLAAATKPRGVAPSADVDPAAVAADSRSPRSRTSDVTDDITAALALDTPSYHSAAFLRKQAVWMALGFIALFVCYSIDYQRWRRWSPYLLGIAIVMLLAVWAPVLGRRVNGASRWIGFGPLTIQPSEYAKIAMVLFLAHRLAASHLVIRTFRRGFLPHVLLLGAVSLLILKEPDLGTTACLGIVSVAMFHLGGMKRRHIALLLIGAACVVALELTVPYRRARLLAFLDPETYSMTYAWQLNQSLIALGSGGPDGLGLGAGPQKYQFLSEAYTDFVFAIIGEELGLLGTLTLAALFLSLFLLGWRTAYLAPDLYGSLLAAGITCMFGVSAFIHMFVNAGLVPTKGLNLPFISYGGSSLLANLAAAGILLSVSRAAEIHRAHAGDPGATATDTPALHRGGERSVVMRRRGESRELALPPSFGSDSSAIASAPPLLDRPTHPPRLVVSPSARPPADPTHWG